jgi:tRNA(Ile)-lysidine synthase
MHGVLPLALTKLRAPAAPPLVLGYSGGGDSTFLLRQIRANGAPVLALIVDHRLREGSATDAARAHAIAREAGADAEVLSLSWPNGPKPSQAHARAGRLRALAEGARRVGASEILFAHTLDDQAETVLIRLAAQSTWRGLAAMAARSPLPLWPEGRGLTLARPLLGERRAGLRDSLIGEGAAWIEDPANELARYTRVRARKQLGEWEAQGLGAARWAALAGRFAALAAAAHQAARDCLDEAAMFDEGAVQLNRARFLAYPAETKIRALAVLTAAVSGSEREPGETAVAGVLAGEGDVTLGGAWIQWTKEGLHLTRDPGAILGREGRPPLAALELAPGLEAVWDRRLALVAQAPGWRCAADSKTCAPVFLRGNTVLTLSEARQSGVIVPHWLHRERIAHLLWR